MVDFALIKELEGFRTNGYVPAAGSSRSGVTVGAGVDLAHMDVNRLAIPDDLKQKLSIYRGVTGRQAQELLRRNPLSLTEDEANLLTEAAHSRHEMFIKNRWNAESDVKWSSLPEAVKTVVYSVMTQYGSPERVPRFWSRATSLDTDGMLSELRNFGDDYSRRRGIEADYLQRGLRAERDTPRTQSEASMNMLPDPNETVPATTTSGLISLEQAKEIVARANSGEQVSSEDRIAMLRFVEDKVKGLASYRDQKLRGMGLLEDTQEQEAV